MNKKKFKLKKINIFLLIASTIFIIFLVYSNKEKNVNLLKSIETIKEKIPSLNFKNSSCFVLNGCMLKNVTFDLMDKKIQVDEVILSDKILEIFSKNFKNDKVGGVVLLNNINIREKNNTAPPIPKEQFSGTIIFKLGYIPVKNKDTNKTTNRSIINIDFILNKGFKSNMKDENIIYKILLSGYTEKKLDFRSWNNIPELTNNKILLNNKGDMKKLWKK